MSRDQIGFMKGKRVFIRNALYGK